MVALFATLTFALTSCGDDDDEDESNLGNGNSGLIIDGTKYSFEFWNYRIFEQSNNHTAFECNLRANDGKELTFTIYDWDNTKSGTVFTAGDEIAVWWDGAEYDACGDMNYTIAAGSVKIETLNKNAKKLSLSFNNVKYSCKRHNTSFTLNGKISLSY